MDFVTVTLLVVFWFVRPQDVVPSLAGFPFVRYVMIAAIFAMWRREGGFNLKEVLRSPVDWLLYGYLAWILLTSESFTGTFKEVFNLAAFYTTTVLALNNERRFKRYLSVWLACLLILTAMALGSHFGFEIVQGSQQLTTGFGERLALNTWIFNNPNSLGHAVVAIIPLSYVWLWWRRGFMSKLTAASLMTLAGYCVSLTQSKGAYLAGVGALVVCLLFGKTRKVQIMIIALMMTAGLSAIKLLPRMETLSSKEEGIAGRLLIWQMARTAMQNTGTGVGWKQFQAVITSEDGIVMSRPAHGAYVAVGADLGYGGLMLYVGVLYCGLRTVWQSQFSEDDKWQRIQRMLLAMLACYGLSAWVLDKAYHTDYFLIAATISAFHRMASARYIKASEHNLGEAPAVPGIVQSLEISPLPALTQSLALAGNYPFERLDSCSIVNRRIPNSLNNSNYIDSGESIYPTNSGLRWLHLTWSDWLAIFATLQLVLYLWHYLSTSFISF